MQTNQLPSELRPMELFLQCLGESLPQDVYGGICNGYVILLMQAAMINAEAKEDYFSRLSWLEKLKPAEIIMMGNFFKEYLSAYQTLVAKEIPNLNHRVAVIKDQIAVLNKKRQQMKNEPFELKKLDQRREELDKEVASIRKSFFDFIDKEIAALPHFRENIKIINFAKELYIFINALVSNLDPGRSFKLKTNQGQPITQYHLLELLRFTPPVFFAENSAEINAMLENASKNIISLHATLTKDEITKVVEQFREGDFVRIFRPKHVMYAAMENGQYQLFNPPKQLQKFNNKKEMTDAIMEEMGFAYSYFTANLLGEPSFFSIGFQILPTKPLENKYEKTRPTSFEIFKDILKSRGKNHNVNAQAKDGSTALLMAAIAGETETVKELLKQGANVDLADDEGFTPLIAAVMHGYHEIINLLITKADVNKTGLFDISPIIIAAESNDLETVKILAEHKANLDTCQSGATALYVASQEGHIEIVNFLISQRVNMNTPIEAKTAVLLNYAETLRKKTEMEILLKEKNQGTIPDTLSGFTPLHAAVFFGHTEVVIQLLTHGANPTLQFSGLSIIDIAQTLKHTAILKVLENWNLESKKIYKPNLFQQTTLSSSDPIVSKNYGLGNDKK